MVTTSLLVLLTCLLAACSPHGYAPVIGSASGGQLGAVGEWGALTFTPEHPASGQPVQVTYRSGSLLAGADRLVLRARLRTAEHGEYLKGTETRVVAELLRGRDGQFRGAIQLPDSVVYAIFAVATPDGSRVDTNAHRGWDLPVHGAHGLPLSAALEQRAYDHMGRDWQGGLAAARERARLYPEDPASWYLLRHYEQWALGPAGAAGTREMHRALFQVFDGRLFTQPGLSGDEIAVMAEYAVLVGGKAATERWKERLQREHPSHPALLLDRAVTSGADRQADPGARLSALDRLWGEMEADLQYRLLRTDLHEFLASRAFALAGQVRDADALLRWAARWDRHDPVVRSSIGQALAVHPVTRAEGIRRLRVLLGELERGIYGHLFRTRDVQKDDAAAVEAGALFILGWVLFASGDTAAAVDTLRVAVSREWEPRALRSVAAAQIEAGDSAGALMAYARIAVLDTSKAAALADTVRLHTGRHFQPDRWSALVRQAQAERRERTLRRSVDRPLHPDLALPDSTGTLTALGGATGKPTVVVFWGRHCPESVAELPTFQQVATRLGVEGIRVLAVTGEQRSPALAAFVEEKGLRVPVLHDAEQRGATAFGSFATPQYFIVDGAGRIRFAYSTLSELSEQLTLLRTAMSP